MNFFFTQSSKKASFLPRQVVKSIPSSSTKMAEILNKFAAKPGSIKAEVMENTIEVCEESGIKGEDKYCATSLESMLDFTILRLGRNVQALSTEVMQKKETKNQQYTITNGVKKVGGANLVVCHKLNYVYAVFYCHKIENTVAYTVWLEGADGSRVKAVSVCHRDTSQWYPKHLAFQMLKVKRGSVPICHFLYEDTVAWVPKQN
ncbi:BURP domain protein RD22-like [Neltuma alba]|uniref:BURP domain protein RD22-like n=1 Tax=Neltuma alba TaxID=207710 RepID=UPI0010A540D6|nr:BURP domain protein RD22-like [Prosopis alba]